MVLNYTTKFIFFFCSIIAAGVTRMILDFNFFFAFGISVIIGVLGRVTYESIDKTITRKKLLQFLGLGIFIGYLTEQILLYTNHESWRYFGIPIAAYSATYITHFFDKENGKIFRQIIELFLKSKLKDDTISSEEENKENNN